MYEKTFFDQLPNELRVVKFISNVKIEEDDLSNSSKLLKILTQTNDYVLKYFEQRYLSSDSKLAFWGLHSIALKLEILKALLLHQLCIPQLYRILGMGSESSGGGEGGILGWFNSTVKEDNSIQFTNFCDRAKALLIEAYSLLIITEESVATEGERALF
jgi:hypothetical protein